MAPLKRIKQEKFCLEYFACGNATEAAKKAGYSPKYVATNTPKLLKNTNIVARLKELQGAAADATIMSVKERKERLSEIGRARLVDFIDGDGKPFISLDIPYHSAASEYTLKTGYTKQGDEVIVTSIKLRDPIAAIQELNKMEGSYAPERHELTGKDGESIQTFVFLMPDGTKVMPKELMNGAQRAG